MAAMSAPAKMLGGRIARQPSGADFVRTDGDRAVYRAGSGTFTFTTAQS